jgi:hypothetical protein
MKRLAWLLLGFLCTALVQVTRVEGQPATPKCCHCCQLPGCCLPVAGVPATARAEEPAQAAQAPVLRALPASLGVAQFYAGWVEPAAIRPVLSASAEAAHPARVPLFKAHCCFLI